MSLVLALRRSLIVLLTMLLGLQILRPEVAELLERLLALLSA